MKLKIFTVYDTKALAYLPPFFLPNELMAKRVFGDMADDINHQFGKHPEDYSLYEMGDFDDGKAKFEISAKAPILLITGLMAAAERKLEKPSQIGMEI